MNCAASRKQIPISNLIKAFMVEQGYIRVAPDILNMSDFD